MRILPAVSLIALSTALLAQTPSPAVPDCPELARALQDVVRNDARLRDWPLLARYRDDNRALKPPAGSDVRVVFMGDSITDAWDDPRYGGFFPGKPYVNRGISGQTTPQMLIRFRPDVLALSPKAVVILAGTNDVAGNTGPMTHEEIASNLASMADLAKAHGVKVVLSSVMPVSDYHVGTGAAAIPQTSRRPPERIRAINDWMKNFSAQNGHVYLDYSAALADARGMLKAELSEDDLHPNAKGYAIMNPLVEQAIQRALGAR